MGSVRYRHTIVTQMEPCCFRWMVRQISTVVERLPLRELRPRFIHRTTIFLKPMTRRTEVTDKAGNDESFRWSRRIRMSERPPDRNKKTSTFGDGGRGPERQAQLLLMYLFIWSCETSAKWSVLAPAGISSLLLVSR